MKEFYPMCRLFQQILPRDLKKKVESVLSLATLTQKTLSKWFYRMPLWFYFRQNSDFKKDSTVVCLC